MLPYDWYYSEDPRLTRALNEPRKPPKESVRLSTERGEAAASGERSLAMASCWCTRLSADGFL